MAFTLALWPILRRIEISICSTDRPSLKEKSESKLVFWTFFLPVCVSTWKKVGNNQQTHDQVSTFEINHNIFW